MFRPCPLSFGHHFSSYKNDPSSRLSRRDIQIFPLLSNLTLKLTMSSKTPSKAPSKTPSKTASKTKSSGSSSSSVSYQPQVLFSPDLTLKPSKDSQFTHQSRFHPLCEALVFCADGTIRRDLFKLMKDKPIVHSYSHNEPRPDSRLLQWNESPCDKFSLLQTPNYHLLYVAPGKEEGLEPNIWMKELASGDAYLLKVKDPHGKSLAYEHIWVPDQKPPAEQKQFWGEIAAEIEIAMKARFRAMIGLSTMISGLASRCT